MTRLITIILVLIGLSVRGQDLNARVQVLSPQIQASNKRTLEILEYTVREFLNNRKWTSDGLQSQERIDCSVIITIKEWDGSSNFKAEAQILSSRPVYGTSYNSTVLNISDKAFDFSYSEGQPLDFSDEAYISNLSSLLAYYAYIIVGFDYDTFSKFGGTLYFNRAQNVLNNAQNAPYSGWKGFDGMRNRFWLVENLHNKNYSTLRENMYQYHRLGLDIMADNLQKGRRVIASVLPELQKVDKQNQGSMLGQLFFTAKADELVNIFSGAAAQERVRAYNLLTEIDPANSPKYEALKSGK
jgi:hypothetical protein